MAAGSLDTCPWKGSIVLAQHDHAPFTRNVAFHKTLSSMKLVNNA